MRKTVLLVSGKSEDVKCAVDILRNWFGGDTKLSETPASEVSEVYQRAFGLRAKKTTSEARI